LSKSIRVLDIIDIIIRSLTWRNVDVGVAQMVTV